MFQVCYVTSGLFLFVRVPVTKNKYGFTTTIQHLHMVFKIKHSKKKVNIKVGNAKLLLKINIGIHNRPTCFHETNNGWRESRP